MARKGSVCLFRAAREEACGGLLCCVPPVPLKGLGGACKQRGEGRRAREDRRV
jgi:hypothetical protein